MTIKQFLILLIVCLVIAAIFFFVPASFLSIIYFRLIAIAFVLMGIIKLALTSVKDEKRELIFNLSEGFIAIIFGVVYYHFYTNLVVDIVCFLVIAIIPILRLIFAEHKINQVGFDSLKYIGLISLLGGYSIMNKPFFIFCGSIWLIIAIILTLYYLKGRMKNEQKD